LETALPERQKESLSGPFFWLSAFYFVYCGRPGDLISVLAPIPLAKITGLIALLSLFASIGKAPRQLKDLPKEASYLSLLIGLFFVSAILSPVWKGGAFFSTIDFSKVYVAWVLTFLLVTSLSRLRRIIFIQSFSVILVCLLAIIKGRSVPRLDGVMGGFYSNPNDMAFAIVLSFPFCLAFLLTAKSPLRKAFWGFGMLAMAAALVLTASRAGFIDMVFAGTICLWRFGVKGKRPLLIVATVVMGAVLLVVAGHRLMDRFSAISSQSVSTQEEETARASYEERRLLMVKSIEAITHYPILGVGVENFAIYSGMWKQVHASYLQIAAEGGIPIMILYLLFFSRGFANLRRLSGVQNLDRDTALFLGALKASLVGFIVGACFAPEAYQYFPYFTVCYTSVFLAIKKEQGAPPLASSQSANRRSRSFTTRSLSPGGSSAFTPAG
jgi:O-antigen ligase